jgi:isopentenyl-diphosphate Delta-isomerase
VQALLALRADRPGDLRLIASGGISDGLAIAKCITLGADLAGSARPLLTALFEGGQDALRKRILSWKHDLGGAMFLTGCRSVHDLRLAPLIHRSTMQA